MLRLSVIVPSACGELSKTCFFVFQKRHSRFYVGDRIICIGVGYFKMVAGGKLKNPSSAHRLQVKRTAFGMTGNSHIPRGCCNKTRFILCNVHSEGNVDVACCGSLNNHFFNGFGTVILFCANERREEG